MLWKGNFFGRRNSTEVESIENQSVYNDVSLRSYREIAVDVDRSLWLGDELSGVRVLVSTIPIVFYFEPEGEPHL
jgi:hypothetical protein